MGHGKAYRPKLARCSLQQRIIHRKRQPRLTASVGADELTHTQRVVQVSRVHHGTSSYGAHLQRGLSLDFTTPSLHKRAILQPVLPPDTVKAVIQRTHVRCKRAVTSSRRRMVDTPPHTTHTECTRAMYRSIRCQRCIVLATAHLEVAIGYHTLHQQLVRFNGKRLHEVDAVQRGSRCRCPRHLEIPGARKDDAALHNVIGDEGVDCTSCWRAEGGCAV